MPPTKANSNPYSKSFKARERKKRGASKSNESTPPPASKKKSKSSISDVAAASKPPPESMSHSLHKGQVATLHMTATTKLTEKRLNHIITTDKLKAKASSSLKPQVANDKAIAGIAAENELDGKLKSDEFFGTNLHPSLPEEDDTSLSAAASLKFPPEAAPNTTDFTSPESFQGNADEWSGDMNIRAEQHSFSKHCDDKDAAAMSSKAAAAMSSKAAAADSVCYKFQDELNDPLLNLLAAGVHYETTPPPEKAAVALKSPQDYTSDDEVEAAMKKFLEQDTKSEESLKYAAATAHSDTHESRRQHVFGSFLKSINKNKELYGDMGKYVRDDGGRLVPKLILKLGGAQPTSSCIRLASMALWYFAKDLKKLRPKENECPFLEPTSHNTYMKTLLGYMKETYNWDYSTQHDFNFQGGYTPRINTLFAERMKAYPGYGFGRNKQLPQGVEKSSDVDLVEHYPDEKNIVHHQKKCLFTCGSKLGFRGRAEHANLRRCNIIEGKFEPSSQFKDYYFIGFTGLSDKTTKVTATNDFARDTMNTMRLPIIDINDPRDPGGILKRYVDKMHPDQDRFYCKPATTKQLNVFKLQGNHNAAMSPLQPYGVNKVAKLLKEIGEETGIDCSGHGLRRLFLTTLVNDSAVSVEESLAAGRHGSVAAQRTYMQRNHASEANRFAALGIKKKEDGK